MNRREFLLASSCLLATPAVALAAQAYEPGLVKQLLAKVRPYLWIIRPNGAPHAPLKKERWPGF
jgi:hypothetical protein